MIDLDFSVSEFMRTNDFSELSEEAWRNMDVFAFLHANRDQFRAVLFATINKKGNFYRFTSRDEADSFLIENLFDPTSRFLANNGDALPADRRRRICGLVVSAIRTRLLELYFRQEAPVSDVSLDEMISEYGEIDALSTDSVCDYYSDSNGFNVDPSNLVVNDFYFLSGATAESDDRVKHLHNMIESLRGKFSPSILKTLRLLIIDELDIPTIAELMNESYDCVSRRLRGVREKLALNTPPELRVFAESLVAR